MKKLFCAFIFIPVFVYSCSIFRQSNPGDDRYWLCEKAIAYGMYLEEIKNNTGQYPDSVTEDKRKNAGKHVFEKVSYFSDHKSYSMKVITSYYKYNPGKRTVIHIVNSNIYWRDDFADADDKIDDVNWNEVEYFICGIYYAFDELHFTNKWSAGDYIDKPSW